MIQIRDKSKCCGCAACVQRCPKQCISFKKDSEGFLYPEADASLCIECRLCEKVCPILQEPHSHIPKQCYAAINPNEDVRKNSSSGGIFTAIATTVLSEGGVVFGARFDTDWSVIHDHTETLEGLAAFQGSKYLQSRVGNTYQQAEKFLKEGRKVLFSGTPCQISGLHHFLRKEYSNLLTVDFICHGVPSPSVWQQYLLETKKQHSIEQITNISFRNKSNGWKKYRFTIEWINHKKEKNIFSEFSYQNIYHLTSSTFSNSLITSSPVFACLAASSKLLVLLSKQITLAQSSMCDIVLTASACVITFFFKAFLTYLLARFTALDIAGFTNS